MDDSRKIAHTPNPIDLHVGARVRMRRKFLGKSQSELADALGLTFQQVQKYERGFNRISASKLYDTARVLLVPVGYFFEGFGEAESALNESESEQAIHGFLMTTEGIELAEAFPRIQAGRLRRKVLDLVRALADDDAS